MNADTLQKVQKIETEGYYFSHDTLGVGGWSYLYTTCQTHTWNTYKIFINDEPDSAATIKARNDDIAINLFHKTFDLDDCDYDIVRIILDTAIIESKYNR